MNLRLLFILCIFTKNLMAQDSLQSFYKGMRCDNLTTIEKAKELVTFYQKQGYETYRGGFFNFENKTMQPFLIDMSTKASYGIIVVGQPDLNFLEVGLGHDAFGKDEVRDRIRKRRDREFSTFFTYVPPFDGRYLLSVTERVQGRKTFCTAIYVMRKVRGTISTVD